MQLSAGKVLNLDMTSHPPLFGSTLCQGPFLAHVHWPAVWTEILNFVYSFVHIKCTHPYIFMHSPS